MKIMIDCPKKCISTIKAETENAQDNHNDHRNGKKNETVRLQIHDFLWNWSCKITTRNSYNTMNSIEIHNIGGAAMGE